jgi:hypothetical protein
MSEKVKNKEHRETFINHLEKESAHQDEIISHPRFLEPPKAKKHSDRPQSNEQVPEPMERDEQMRQTIDPKSKPILAKKHHFTTIGHKVKKMQTDRSKTPSRPVTAKPRKDEFDFLIEDILACESLKKSSNGY